MNDGELKHKVNVAMFSQIKTRRYATPVDVLMDCDILSKSDYENWRRGQVPYLEKVCKVNLRKLNTAMREMKEFAKKNHLKSSWTCYKQWGQKHKIILRFSKSGDPNVERSYATHFVSDKQKASPE